MASDKHDVYVYVRYQADDGFESNLALVADVILNLDPRSRVSVLRGCEETRLLGKNLRQ